MAAPVGDRDEGPILDQKDSPPVCPDQIKSDRLCAPPPPPGKKNNQEKQRGGKSGREGNGKEIDEKGYIQNTNCGARFVVSA